MIRMPPRRLRLRVNSWNSCRSASIVIRALCGLRVMLSGSVLSVFLSLAISMGAAEADAGQRPNVLFILCDDLRWDALGYAGNRYVKTPNIDRLAKEGVYFKNAFCTTSLCSPSRASILSGLYAHRHGVRDNFTEFPSELPNLASLLKRAGYATAYIGKWHMGEDNDAPRPGFDH